MTPTVPDGDIRSAIQRAGRAHRKIAKASEARDDAVLEALEAGASQAALARELEMTHTSIQFMRDRAQARQGSSE